MQYVHRLHGARGWLTPCATSRKVPGSIPGRDNGIFHLHNPSGRTMALELTQPLIEMIKGGRRVGLKILAPSCADCVEIWEPHPLEILGSVQVCNGIVLPLPLHRRHSNLKTQVFWNIITCRTVDISRTSRWHCNILKRLQLFTSRNGETWQKFLIFSNTDFKRRPP